jgi:hypothetical protein
VKGPGVGPVFSTALKGVSAITDKLVDVALQLAPADTSPGVVRVAVNATLVLVALSFVKSLLGVSLSLLLDHGQVAGSLSSSCMQRHATTCDGSACSLSMLALNCFRFHSSNSAVLPHSWHDFPGCLRGGQGVWSGCERHHFGSRHRRHRK